MQLPLTDPDTLFEELLQDLPAETVQMARAFKAFVMDLVSLQFLEVLVSDVHTGETLKHFTLAPGDVVLADRGYAPCQGMRAALDQGAALIVRLNPFSVVLGDAAGAPLELSAALKRQTTATLRTLPVVLRAAGGQHEVQGWVHAYRLNVEQANRARHKCRQGHKKRHAERGEPLFGRLGIGVYHAGAGGTLSPDDHGAVPLSLASGNRHKTLEECARCRCVAGESEQPPGQGVAPWELALCVDAGATHAAAVGGQLGPAGSRAYRHVVARLGHAQRRAGTDDYRCLLLEGGCLGSMPEGIGGTASPEAMTTAASRGA